MAFSDRGIPIDIVEKILDFLDFSSIIKCRAVCSNFRNVIDSSPSCHWKMELAIAGKMDGENHPLPLRRAMLKQHQKGWADLRWTEERRWRHMRGSCWELYGNVLSQCSADRSILQFKLLPSQSRGIEGKTWTVDIGDLALDDFTIDPAQDLLVVVEEPQREQQGDNRCRVFLWTLKTGDPHPCVVGNNPLTYSSPNLQRIREKPWPILITGDTLAIHFDQDDPNAESEVILLNWKTGNGLGHIVAGNLKSMAFLSEKYLMFGVLLTSTEFRIIVVDFVAEPSQRRHLTDVEHSYTFHFPMIAESIVIRDVDIRSDPAPGWKPDPTSSMPFYTGKDRLYVISLFTTNAEATDQMTQLYALDRSFISQIEGIPCRVNQDFDWNMWGPNGARWIGPQTSSSGWHTRYVYGTRYTSTMQRPGSPVDYIYLYNFNQLALRWGKANGAGDNGSGPTESNISAGADTDKGQEETSSIDINVTEPTKIPAGNLFQDEVETKLGYQIRRWRLQGRLHVRSVMCSEDGMVIVNGNLWAEEFHILTV